MIATSRVSLAALAAVALTASAASAATITSAPLGSGPLASPPPVSFNVGDSVSFTTFLDSGEGSVTFTFTANEAAKIVGFSLAAVGELSDMDLVSISSDSGLTGDTMFATTPFGPGASTGFGGGFLENFVMTSGQTVNVILTETSALTSAVNVQAFFQAVQVPVPGGVLLLSGALGGLVLAKRRKAMADA